MRRCLARPPPRRGSPPPGRTLRNSTRKKGRPAEERPLHPLTPLCVRRAVLPDVGDAPLSLRLGCGRRLRGKLQDCRLLTLDEFGQQDGLPIRKFERVMMHSRLVLVDLPKDRRLVGHPARAQAEESGRRAGDLPGKREFRSRKNAHRHGGVFLGGKSPRAGTKVARRELVANSRSTRLHIVKAVVAHGEAPLVQAPRTLHLRYSRQERCHASGKLWKEDSGYAADGVAAASTTSSNVRRPARGVLTSTAMLRGGCRLVRISSCACGILVQGKTSLMQGSIRRSSTNWLAAEACLRWAKCEPCMRFCRIHT